MSIKKNYYFAKDELFDICRSITGLGIQKTLKLIKKKYKDLKIINFKSGQKVFDWKIPNEWNISDAYVLDPNNKKIIDFKINNLHLVGYSIPINKLISKDELIKKFHYIRNQKYAIPYVTSYYNLNWGFCITYDFFKKFSKQYNKKDKFRVVIKSSFKKNGNLSLGELLIKGKKKQEILVSTYICHPSMANNELSGPIVAMSLIEYFKKKKKPEYSLRFLFIPETIGSISYLSKNLKKLKNFVLGGYNLTCIGDDRQHSCMLSKYKNSPSDFALIKAYKQLKIKNYKVYSFLNRGSDERQYNSPGIDLNIASIFRTKYWNYPEYHTSLDNFELVTLKGVRGGFNVAKNAINNLLKEIYPKYSFLCEPQMSKRKLYPNISKKNIKNTFKNYLDFLQYADGKNTLKDICKYTNIKLDKGKKIYNVLKKEKILLS